jgi:Uma2 family endonuclease
MIAYPITKLYSVADFEAFIAQPENVRRNFELINGVIVEKAMPTEEHALITGIFTGELYIHARAKGTGLPGPEHRFRVPGDDQNVRQPDIVLIVEADSPVTTKGATERVPDFVVEVKSPDDTYDAMRQRAQYYGSIGVKMSVLVFPRPKIVEVYQPGKPSEVLTIEDSLDGGDVLPGFVLPIDRLFVTRRGGT